MLCPPKPKPHLDIPLGNVDQLRLLRLADDQVEFIFLPQGLQEIPHSRGAALEDGRHEQQVLPRAPGHVHGRSNGEGGVDGGGSSLDQR